MPLIYRNITGPVQDAQGNPIASATLTIKLLSPIVDDTSNTFVAPYKLSVDITNGVFSTTLAAPGRYEFTLIETTGNTTWSFQVCLSDEFPDDISLGELFVLSLIPHPCACC
jgi:hypothetical protein